MLDVCETWKLLPSQFRQLDLDDQHQLVMHQIRKGEVCRGCGTHPDETDPRRGGDPDAYTTDLRFCRVCDIRSAAEKQLDKQREQPGYHVPASATVVVVPRKRQQEEVPGG